MRGAETGGDAGRGIIGYFLSSFRVTVLLMVGLALLGAWSVLTLPREATPEVTIPVAIVVTPYPGAAARDVEELVTVPVEDAVSGVEGVDTVQSSSRLGISSVTVTFAAEEDLAEALRRVREAADNIRGLPAAAEDPQVLEVNFSNEPIISLALSGADTQLLSVLADDLAARIEAIAGVSQVDVVGGRGAEISVRFDPQQIATHGLSIGAVLQAIRAGNVDAPLGQIETDRFQYDVRLPAGFVSVSDVAGLPVRLSSGQTVPLETLAEVRQTLAEETSYARVSVAGSESKPAVTLAVRKKAGGNIVRIIDEAQQVIADARGELLPPEVQVVASADRADEIRTSLANVSRSGLQTLLIVFGLLWLFLGWRAALIASLAVPLSFALSFLVFDQTQVTLNNISLFSLILSLGLLVDTAIVVVEGVVQQYEAHGPEGLLARTADVVRRFARPLTSGTLTTVAAFFPMLLVSGIIGEFLRVIPIVVAATLISSLLVALLFIPVVAARMLGRHAPVRQQRYFDVVFSRWQATYRGFVERILSAGRFQRRFIGGLALLLVLGLALPFTGVLQTGLFPAVDTNFILINVELPPGSRLEQTDIAVRQVETLLHAVPEVASYTANVGSGISLDFTGGGSSASSHLASFYVNLNPGRERSSLEISDSLRIAVRDVPGASVTIEDVSAGPPAAAPIELRVVGPDLSILDRLSQDVMDELSSLPGAQDIDRSLRYTAGEFRLLFDRDALAGAGLTPADVAQLLRNTIFGQEATTFLDERGSEVSVRAAASADSVDSIDDLLVLPLVAPSGRQVLVGEVARAVPARSIDSIRRRDGERAVTVTADAARGTAPNTLTAALQDRLSRRQLPAGYRIEFGGEQQETTETFADLYRSMIIAVVLIVLILVVEFDSYRQPLLIFLSIPLALIGVLFGLVLTGGQLNFAAFIGLVSLTGIVVNNAIILVDRMNALLADGLPVRTAAAEASASRLRPILLTTLTTAAGVAPLIWVDDFFRDMALTLITGLLFSTVITLVLVPILYVRQQEKLQRRYGRRPSTEPAAPSPVP
ncbi:MAG: hypothetical protein COT71_00495 [Candidatus Andersenbacteria bacterium CG10_big_fil_rev_8_21_14_0_10_54_11]|uniref:AcrB/AcrD/AcrF family protein n=1 Tax=Candidatus Andersenbacteria bacterium CG10_big_fil_rev_8_21_14_0_10_54_11 TaxID=1974485 RepID=A0A2M6X0E0_9BACT|nr:MAG: hypothetical protein COT71_00495 [Candidatus Andersenbacteria bacterium CG10_big_fil_rev_8_21_14_0_10_54_11]